MGAGELDDFHKDCNVPRFRLTAYTKEGQHIQGRRWRESDVITAFPIESISRTMNQTLARKWNTLVTPDWLEAEYGRLATSIKEWKEQVQF